MRYFAAMQLWRSAAYCLWLLIAVVGIGLFPNRLRGEAWPTYRHDHARSGATSENLPIPLQLAWEYQAPARPRPAWDEPATWDGYNKVYNMSNRQVFDKALHVVAAGDHVFFGSSIDHKVYCLDARTGEQVWVFFTEGPVRLAPTLAEGKVFVGSDDGHVYCLDAASGKLLWRHRPGPQDLRVAGNGRVISLWPVRTSVVVMENVAYCCVGVFPSETVYLCAMDADSGKELWKTPLKDFPAQGYMLASRSRLYVTTGRERPLVFDRGTGTRLFQVQGGGGGTYALLTGDLLLYGPGKAGELSASRPDQKEQLATFAGNHMIVAGGLSYLHTNSELSCLDRGRYITLFGEARQLMGERRRLTEAAKKATSEESADLQAELDKTNSRLRGVQRQMAGCVRWKSACEEPFSLILAGGHLIAGGDGQIAAYDVESGNRSWTAEVHGQAYGLAVAEGRLYASTDEGAIHCFAPNP